MNGERGRRTRESTLSQFGVASRESSFEGDKERKGLGRIRGYEGKEKERHEASARQQMVKVSRNSPSGPNRGGSHGFRTQRMRYRYITHFANDTKSVLVHAPNHR